jgi:hypothetical protein
MSGTRCFVRRNVDERSKRGRLLEGTFRGKDATRREDRSVASKPGPEDEHGTSDDLGRKRVIPGFHESP